MLQLIRKYAGNAIRKALYNYTADKPCRLIKRSKNQPYFERYYIGQLLGKTFYLHRFIAPDGDEEMHDHPFRAVSFCLAGWYVELRTKGLCPQVGYLQQEIRISPLRPNYLGLMSFHRIWYVRPETWTLFIHGRRHKSWGFLRAISNFKTKMQEGVHYDQPLALSDPEWWHTTPLGRDAGREPLKLR